jgi:hypothetical protein
VWAAVKDNINYKIDPPGVQWIRTPARLWADKEGDCKSFSVFIGSCLHQLGIPFTFRFVSFDDTNATPTHVYVVVPVKGGKEIYLDAVLPQFNVQKPFTYKQDFKMPTAIARLSGVSATYQDVANALAAEYQALKRAGKLNKLQADQYSFYYNALLQKGDAIGDVFSDLFNSATGCGTGGGGSLDIQTAATTAANAFLPGSGAILQTVLNLFAGSDPLKDYEGWDAQDAAAGRSKGSTVRGYVLGNGDDVVREAKNIASYIQTYGLDILTNGNPWNGVRNTARPWERVATDGKSWADVTVQEIADKLQRGGLGTQAQQLLNPSSYQNTTNNTGGNAGTNSGNTNGGNGGNTGSSNMLVYVGIAAVAAYFLLKK